MPKKLLFFSFLCYAIINGNLTGGPAAVAVHPQITGPPVDSSNVWRAKVHTTVDSANVGPTMETNN